MNNNWPEVLFLAVESKFLSNATTLPFKSFLSIFQFFYSHLIFRQWQSQWHEPYLYYWNAIKNCSAAWKSSDFKCAKIIWSLAMLRHHHRHQSRWLTHNLLCFYIYTLVRTRFECIIQSPILSFISIDLKHNYSFWVLRFCKYYLQKVKRT